MRLAAAAAALVLAATPAAAFGDGAPWESANGDGCAACHFGAPPVEASDGLALEGLPARIEPGASYRLTVRLADADMALAGFLLAARQGEDEAGRFAAVDARSEAAAATVRSTTPGSVLTAPGESRWLVDWQAPRDGEGAIRFMLWGNAANGDESNLADRIHRREWARPLAR